MKFNENFRWTKSQSASVINFKSTHTVRLCTVMINSSTGFHAIVTVPSSERTLGFVRIRLNSRSSMQREFTLTLVKIK